MNENINLVEILKNAPKGTKLWSPVCGECEIMEVGEYDNDYPIVCMTKSDVGSATYATFTANGEFCSAYANKECVLFPSKENRDWQKFEIPKKHKRFEPFQKVLSITDDYRGSKIWAADLFSHYDENLELYYLVSGYYTYEDKIIPYEGNEDLLGKVVEK